MKSHRRSRRLFPAILAFGVIAMGACAVADELCEPARLLGQVGIHQTADEGSDRVMMRAPHMMRGRGHGPAMGRRRGNPVRHRIVMMGPGLPRKYIGLRNPLPATAENIAAGSKIYAENCASCHGAQGFGDGEAGRELQPPPANLAFTVGRPIASDGFLFWAITEGGEKLNTAMPAFADVLSERQRWQLILFLRRVLAGGG